MKQEPLSYEQSFERLENILELMNSGKVPLEEALKLFEEAEILMQTCQKALGNAERKIEQLVKGRDGEIILGKEKNPTVEPLNL